jgi:hypothetical protein
MRMRKKILIGSVVSVVILILLSFTSVVGYNSIESDIQSSPLFNIRSSRAIDEENEEFTYDYVGNGNTIDLLIPNRDDKTVLIQRFIEIISKMDDETFNEFVTLIIHRIQQSNEFKHFINNDEIFVLNKLRSNQELIISNDFNTKGIYTNRFDIIPNIYWLPFLIPILILLFIVHVIIEIVLITNCFYGCGDETILLIN